MATRKIVPPLKHTTFDEVRSDGTVVVSNEWYDWAMNIGKYVDEIRTILDGDNTDQNVTINDLLTADVPVFAPQMTPTITNGCNPLVAIEFAPTAPNLYALQFLPNVDTSADFHAMLPFYWAGKTFTVWVYWGHGSGGTAFDVLWEIDANSTYDNEPITLDFIGGIGAPDTGGTAGNLYIARSGSVPIASYQNQEGSLASLRLTRRGTYTEDTMDITAYVMAVRFVLEGLPIPDPPVAPDYALLLHFDGDFIDSSVLAHTPTVTGGAATSATQAKFGAESCTRFATFATDKVEFADHADLNFPVDRVFSIDFQIYITSAATSGGVGHNFLFGKWGPTGQSSWAVELYFSDVLNWVHSGNGSTYTFRTATGTLSRDTWHHIAIWKTADKKLHIAVDGTIAFEYDGFSGQNEIFSGTAPLLFGTVASNGPFSAGWFSGVFIDELRIVVDTIDYDASGFTPPASPY